MLNVNEEKERINNMISSVVLEILGGLVVDEDKLKIFEKEFDTFMRALQAKNKIYDYAVVLSYNDLLGRFEGRIAYSLINSEENTYQDMVEFKF